MARVKNTPVLPTNIIVGDDPIINSVEVVDSTVEEKVVEPEIVGEKIAIACCLPFGIRFTDIPNGKGGTKTISFPGINDQLRGKKDGVLALPGNAVCVQLAKADWELLLKLHGKEAAFVGVNNCIPCIYPVGDKAGFASAVRENVIAEMRNGLEAADPNSVNVIEKE